MDNVFTANVKDTTVVNVTRQLYRNRPRQQRLSRSQNTTVVYHIFKFNKLLCTKIKNGFHQLM